MLDGCTALRIRHDPGHRTLEHAHREGQVFLVKKGALLVNSSQGAWSMPQGYVAWIPPGHQHFAVHYGRVEVSGLYLPPSLCAGLPERPAVLRRTEVLCAVLERLAVGLPELGQETRGAHLLAVLLDELAEAEEEPLALPSPREARLARIAKALMDDPAEHRSLEELAREFALSRRTLSRLFRQETGLSVGQWRLRRRMIAAMGLLAEGNSVTETAFLLGYESSSAFIQAFRRVFGVTPSLYWTKTKP